MQLIRYTATLHQDGCPDRTMSVVATSIALARAKALYAWSHGLPFVTFRKSNIAIATVGPVERPAWVTA